MQLGMIGLGRMGANRVRRLMQHGHECVVFDANAEAVAELNAAGAKGTSSIEAFIKQLNPPQGRVAHAPRAGGGGRGKDGRRDS